MTKPIFVLGDIHGNFNYLMHLIKSYDLNDCYIIQVGDFNIGFTTDDNDRKTLAFINQFLAARNVVMYVIRGNHDNPVFFKGNHNNSHLILVEDYSTITIEGLNFFMVGGAISLDRFDRKEGYDYWKDEGFVYNDDKIDNAKGIDIVITHNAPNFCYPREIGGFLLEKAQDDKTLLSEVMVERHKLSYMFDVLHKNNDIRNWYYGHYHKSYVDDFKGVEFHLLAINEMKEVRIRERNEYTEYEEKT